MTTPITLTFGEEAAVAPSQGEPSSGLYLCRTTAFEVGAVKTGKNKGKPQIVLTAALVGVPDKIGDKEVPENLRGSSDGTGYTRRVYLSLPNGADAAADLTAQGRIKYTVGAAKGKSAAEITKALAGKSKEINLALFQGTNPFVAHFHARDEEGGTDTTFTILTTEDALAVIEGTRKLRADKLRDSGNKGAGGAPVTGGDDDEDEQRPATRTTGAAGGSAASRAAAMADELGDAPPTPTRPPATNKAPKAPAAPPADDDLDL
jgi:hypothetical protein